MTFSLDTSPEQSREAYVIRCPQCDTDTLMEPRNSSGDPAEGRCPGCHSHLLIFDGEAPDGYEMVEEIMCAMENLNEDETLTYYQELRDSGDFPDEIMDYVRDLIWDA